MSIRSGEVRIVRVCTEHFLSSGRAANTFSLLHKVARCRLVLAGWLHTGMGSPCGSWQGRVSNGAGSGCAPVPCLPSLHLPVSALPTLAPRTIPRSSVRAGQAGCVLTAQTVNRGASRDPGDRREIQSEQCEVSGAVQALPTRALPRSTECCSVLQPGRNGISLGFMARDLLAALSHQHLPNLLLMSISLEADAAIHTQAHRSTFQSVI